MLSFEDPRWKELQAGYRTPIDLRPVLRRLESGEDAESTWQELWEELHHGREGDLIFELPGCTFRA